MKSKVLGYLLKKTTPVDKPHLNFGFHLSILLWLHICCYCFKCSLAVYSIYSDENVLHDVFPVFNFSVIVKFRCIQMFLI